MSSTFPTSPLAGELVFVQGHLSTVTVAEAQRLIERAGGRVAAACDARTSLIVRAARDAGAPEPEGVQVGTSSPALVARVIDEDEWCRLVGRVGPSTLRTQYYTARHIRSLYPRLRADHLRYLERWGLLRDVVRTPDDTWYGFRDVSVIRQTHAELERGASFRGVLRGLAAETQGQLSLDFRPPRGETPPAKVVALTARERPTSEQHASELGALAHTPAEVKFLEASSLDGAGRAEHDAAMLAYRAALDLDPDLVPAMINLGNLHYLQDRLVEAQALYLQATLVEPECFEAWFNLGNVHHDRGRLEEAAQCYAEALRLRPGYANAHFYLAVTLEKLGRAQQAKPHWRTYQQLAPDGEWIDLAKEFGE
jgi:tetratricopeptide (TPR) repeat protein